MSRVCLRLASASVAALDNRCVRRRESKSSALEHSRRAQFQHGLIARVGVEADEPALLHNIYLPVEDATPVLAPAAPSKTNVLTGTILVVEDEPMIRKLTQRLLVKRGYNVLEAADLSEALALWADQCSAIDLIFTDMVMPGELSGLRLAQRVMAEKPGVSAIAEVESARSDGTAPGGPVSGSACRHPRTPVSWLG